MEGAGTKLFCRQKSKCETLKLLLITDVWASMGIRGLSGFIDANSKDLLLSDVLEGTLLVIDGYNILHELYYSSPAGTTYGGDYDQFTKCVEVFCDRLKASNVTVFFVFDGASEIDDSKFRTLLSRAQERIHLAGISSHRKRTKILPCLTFRVSST